MTVRVAINGFGRIGRNVLRAIVEYNRKDVTVLAINDIGDVETNVHLLKYDSIHGPFRGEIKVSGDTFDAGHGPIKVLAERDPSKLPWRDMDIDVVMECTGIFSDREKAAIHLKAGGKKVLVSAPSKGADFTVVYGVNHEKLEKKHEVVSNASCTTNCLAPVAKVINDLCGLAQGYMTTIHAYTNDQRVADQIHEDMYRSRSAAINMIPTKTGAAKAVGEVIPELNGKLTGFAVRVPVPDGSLTDLTVVLKKNVTKEEVNGAFKTASEGPLKGILEYNTDPIVSGDVIGNPHSCIFVPDQTLVIEGNLVKVIGWYDNEWGYSVRTAELITKMGAL